METEIPILYEDADVLVVDKPQGFLSEDACGTPSVIRALASHVDGGFLAPVNRLDREVSGVMLLAKNPKSAAFYTALLSDRTRIKKEYIAVARGIFEEKEGEMCDLLFKDSAKNKSYVVKRMRRGVKEARLSYRVIAEREDEMEGLSLVHILLGTGRTHQIRVQLSHRRHPLVGDRKYGGDPQYPMGLLAYRLTFPNTRGKSITVTSNRLSVAPFCFFDAEI